MTQSLNIMLVAALVIGIAYAQMSIVGSGATTMMPLMNTLVFSFLNVNPAVTVTYLGTGSGAGAMSAITGQSCSGSALNTCDSTKTVDFGASNTIFATTGANCVGPAPCTSTVAAGRKFWSLATSTAPLVLAYNLLLGPEYVGSTRASYIANSGAAAVQPELYLDRPTILKIYFLDIQWWNDTAIQTLNPTVSLPKQRILLVMRSDSSGTTNTFHQYLQVVASSLFPNSSTPLRSTTLGENIFSSPGNTWSTTYLNCLSGSNSSRAACGRTNRLLPATGNFQGAAQTQFNAYSMSYMSLPFLNGLPYVYMQTSYCAENPGCLVQQVKATSKAVQLAIEYGIKMGDKTSPAYATGYVSSTSPIGNLLYTIDAPVDGAWPIAEYDFILIPDIVNQDCTRALQVAQFLSWSVQSNAADDAMTYLSYVAMPLGAQKDVVKTISKLRCAGGESTFDFLYVDQVALQILTYIGAAYLLGLSICVLVKFDHPAIKLANPFVLLYIGFGCIAYALSGLAWLGYATPLQCEARPWVRLFSLVPITGIASEMLLKLFDLNHKLTRPVDPEDPAPAAATPKKTEKIEIELAEATKNELDAETAEVEASLKADVIKVDQHQAYIYFASCMAFIFIISVLFPLILQTSSDPLREVNRLCYSKQYSVVALLIIIWAIVLILVTGVVAARVKDLHAILEPLYIILLDIALFFPIEYLNSDPSFPDRRSIVLLLQPTVGILITPLLEASLLMLPAVIKAFKRTPEEFVEQYFVEMDVIRFAAKERKRMSSKMGISSSGISSAGSGKEDAPRVSSAVSGKEDVPQ